jgi:hypothetical protein
MWFFFKVTNFSFGKMKITNFCYFRKEFGFEKFVSQSIRENMKVKDLRKILAQCMKMNQNLTAPGQKQLTALQAKLHYMKIVSELKTFGSRVFMVTLLVCCFIVKVVKLLLYLLVISHGCHGNDSG